MSATASRPAAPEAPEAPPESPPRRSREASLGIRLLTFAGLGTFAAAHWAALVHAPPLGRVLLAVAVVTAAGALLTWLGRSRLHRPVVHLAALGTVVVAAGLALAAMGLPVRLFGPHNWDDLASLVDRGLSGIRTVVWPYAGPEDEVRLVILLGAPVLLVVAAALTFWPARRGASLLRGLGLVTLLCLYGIPVTDHDPGAPLLRGLVLFALVAAWLWLPRLRGREALPGAALVVAMALVALPLAARLDRGGALVDYSHWNWFGGKELTFDWTHSYGPLDWPRDGTTVLQVKSRRPLYWKAEVLDSFDGLRWTRSTANDQTGPLEEMPADPNPKWNRHFKVTVRSLSTSFVIGAGTPTRVAGAGQAVTGAADGTLRRLEQPLRRGDSYSVSAYDPTPTAAQMRAAPRDYDPELAEYTAIDLPGPGDSALKHPPISQGRPPDQVGVPLVGTGVGDSDAGARLAASPYARAFRLARRITAGAPTTFDEVRDVRDYLERNYTYSEHPQLRRYPLEAFLFQDKIGYCQQFSGAMALLLRMRGIPTRVVTGFSPGSYNTDTGEYRVRDLDAHSWVEVYFSGIGWVTFDPTPPAAPANRAGQSPGAATDVSRDSNAALANAGRGPTSGPAADTRIGAGGSAHPADGGGPPVAVILGAIVAGGLVAGGMWITRHRRRPTSADDRIRELEHALGRLGWGVPGGSTLLDLETRLGRAAGPASARYVAALRAGRFGASGGRPPASADRRAMRKELTGSRGPLRRLRGFLVLPPRGPAA